MSSILAPEVLSMSDQPTTDPAQIVRPLLRVRQYRDFAPEPIDPAALDAIVDAARWSGSSQNQQPWRFMVVTDEPTIRHLAEIGLPQTRGLQTAMAAIAVALPDEANLTVMRAYDEGRAVERILIAASFLGLGGGISWVFPKVLPGVRETLGVPDGWIVRTMVALGHPSDEARKPKSAPGQARKPRSEIVFANRWQG